MSDELAICQTFITTHGPEAARTLERLPGAQVAALLDALPARVAAQALAAMVPTIASDCLTQLSPAHAAAALAELPAGQAAVLLRRLEKTHVAGILEQMSPDDVRLLGTILNYPPDCAGSLMESRVFAATDNLRVGEVLTAVRRLPPQLHDYVFVVDDNHRLVGVARLRDLLSSRRHLPLTGIMNRAISHVAAKAPRAAVLHHPGWKRFHTLPVVDEATVLVGAIAHETIRTIFEEDALGRSSKADTASTVFALGELFWMGLSGVLDGVANAVRRLGTPEGGSGEVSRGGH